ncbi:MAG: DUF4296 domain-containing protein [Bacteroidota bacterium]|nr:DUF4296 domain-containing protein [Bacteroidota bacterium]
MKGKTQIRGYFLQLFIAVSLLSCGKKVPPGILSKQEMVQIMEELYISEEKVNQLALPRDSAKNVFGVISGKLFEDAAVTDSIFRKSFDYYMERPREMELIYTALVDTLQLREQRAPFRTDSE